MHYSASMHLHPNEERHDDHKNKGSSPHLKDLFNLVISSFLASITQASITAVRKIGAQAQCSSLGPQMLLLCH